MKRKVLFLDRDGVLNLDRGFVSKIVDFELVPGVLELVKYFTSNGFSVIIVTNQSGIGRGYFTHAEFEIFMEHLKCTLSLEGIEILDVLYCPHVESDFCTCRKPSPRMFELAITKWNVSIVDSVSIGDKIRDIEAASAAGIEINFLYGKDKLLKGISNQVYLVENLLDVIEIYENVRPGLRF